MDIVDRIFELADKKYQEQRDFAHALNIAPQRVSEWRRRKSESYMKRLPQIADTLGTSVEYLVTGEKKAPAGQEASSKPDILQKLEMLPPEDQEEIQLLIEMKLARKKQRQESDHQ